jgi:hypothetical protein
MLKNNRGQQVTTWQPRMEVHQTSIPGSNPGGLPNSKKTWIV